MHELSNSHTHEAEAVAALALEVVLRMPVAGERWLSHHAVEDVRADAIAAVWRAALRCPAGFLDEDGRPDAGAIGAYATWSLRKGFDEIRRERRTREAAEMRAHEESWLIDATVEASATREDESRLSAAIGRLAPGAAGVVARRRLGWSFGRIAADLGIARNTAIQRYRRALPRLPAELRPLLPPASHRGR